MKIRTEIEPWKMAVRTVAAICAPYHRVPPVLAAWHPAKAPRMVRRWRMMKKKPQSDGIRRRERVRKMQLEADAKSM